MTDIDVTAADTKWRLTESEVGKRPFMTLFEGDRMVCNFCLEGSKGDAGKVLSALQATAQQVAEIAELRAEVERLRGGIKAFLPKNVALDNANIADDMVVPIEGPIGELRTLAALAREGEG